MHNYKIGLLIFTHNKPLGLATFHQFEKMVKAEAFGVIKEVEVLDHRPELINSILEAYKNTNLGMIILMAPDAKSFFPYAELEEVGQRNEKFLVTLNLNRESEESFKKMIEKVKLTPGKPYKGCDASCS